MSENEQYQGWTNRETWAVNLHLSNDQGLYDQVNELAEKTERNPVDLAEEIRTYVEEELLSPEWWRSEMGTPMPEGIESMRSEVGSLWRVNWDEVAKAWLED